VSKRAKPGLDAVPEELRGLVDMIIDRMVDDILAKERSGRSIPSLELLLPQVEAQAEGSASAALQLHKATDKGEALRKRGNKAVGAPRKADDPRERILAINDAALFNALTTRNPSQVELEVRRCFGQIEPFKNARAHRLIAELDPPGPNRRSVDTVAHAIDRGNAAVRGHARLMLDKPQK
jgi:hypothetical protein